jgi:hypothetical protein
MDIETKNKKYWRKPKLQVLNIITNTFDGGNDGNDGMAPPPSGS